MTLVRMQLTRTSAEFARFWGLALAKPPVIKGQKTPGPAEAIRANLEVMAENHLKTRSYSGHPIDVNALSRPSRWDGKRPACQPIPASPEEEDKERAKRAAYFLKQNLLPEAADALQGEPLADVTAPEVEAALRSVEIRQPEDERTSFPPRDEKKQWKHYKITEDDYHAWMKYKLAK